MRFRKKPVVIEAVQIGGMDKGKLILVNSREPEPPWMTDGLAKDMEIIGSVTVKADHVLIRTLEGLMAGNIGDWIIQGVKGELYPCKPDIFALTYERD